MRDPATKALGDRWLAPVDVLRDIAGRLPEGAAEFAVVDDSKGQRGERIASLIPKNPKAATVVVHVEEGVPIVDVVLGDGGYFEVAPGENRYSDLEALDEVRALCLAVVEGRYRETIWLKGDEVVKSHGIVQIGSSERPIHWRQIDWNPFRRIRRFDRSTRRISDRCVWFAPQLEPQQAGMRGSLFVGLGGR